MATTKPYFIRAIFEWCNDQGFTPYLAVVVDSNTRVPREYVKDGQIVLNIGTEATSQLQLGNDEISFKARFNGTSFPVHVPVVAVAAIYARENGQGMAFEAEASVDSAAVDESATPAIVAESEEPELPPPGGKRSHLTRVK